MDKHTENILKNRISKGDKDAFSLVFEEYFVRSYKFILSLVCSSETARDLAQDVFVKLWERRRFAEEIYSLDAYIFTVSRNLALDYLRSRSSKGMDLDIIRDSMVVARHCAGHERIDHASELDAIRDLVSKMPRKRQKVFNMSRFDELSHEEIAKMLNISKKTVSNHLYSAGEEIKKKLG